MDIKKVMEKLKSMLTIYNLALLICGIIFILSLYIVLKPDEIVTPSGIAVVETNIKETEEISEQAARKIAVKQFKRLREKLKKEDLKVIKIQRDGEEHYYITSIQNSLEIKIKGGKITRINAAPIEE